MTAPSRRGLFGLLAGASLAPIIARFSPAVPATVDWSAVSPVRTIPLDYVVTREVLEDNLFEKMTCSLTAGSYVSGFNVTYDVDGPFSITNVKATPCFWGESDIHREWTERGEA